jgi:hypothetical protein
MEYSRDEGARKFQDAFTQPFHADGQDYNRNQDSHAAENVRRWYDYWRERPGGGDRVSSGGVNIVFSDNNTHFRRSGRHHRVQGEPAKNLGYVTLPLNPVKGSRLRIALTGPTVHRDAFGKIVEITGARAGLDTGAEKAPMGAALAVIEAELYRRP